MDFYLIVIFSDRIQQHVRVFTLREESAARCFKGSSTGWISRCVCWLLMSFSTRQQTHRGGGAWQRLSRVWALICCVVGPIWTQRAWWTTAHSCNVELNVKLNDFCSPSIVLTGKYMLKETKSQGIHLKTKLRSRKLVGRTNSCFFLPFLLCWGGNLSDRGERWFPPPERRPGRWSWSETCRCRDGEARRHCETRTAAGSISLSSLTAGVFSAADHVCYVSYEITMLRYFLGFYATRYLLLCRFKLQIQNTFCLITTVTYRIQSMATMSVMSSGGRPTDVSTITMVTRPAWGIPAAPMLAAVAVMLQDRTTRMRTTEEEAGSLLGRRVMPSELRNSSEPERPALSPVKDPWGDILSGDSTLKPKQTLKKKFWYWRCQIYKFSSRNFLFDSVIVSMSIF